MIEEYKKAILEIVKSQKKVFDSIDLSIAVGVYNYSSPEDIQHAIADFNKALTSLEQEKNIVRKGTVIYYYALKDHLIYETLRYADNHFYIVHKGHTINIPNAIAANAMEKDIVAVEIGKDSKGRDTGRIKEIIQRKERIIILEAKENEYGISLVPKTKTPIQINVNNINNYHLIPNDLFSAIIDEHGNCSIKERIGNTRDVDYQIKMIIAKHDLKVNFSEKAMAEVRTLSPMVTEKDLVGCRDLRNRMIFTADGQGAGDFDDAISLYINEKGNYVLGVHIADVSHYIKPGMELWNEAMERGYSGYYGSEVNPMFPFEISNGICSLKPNVDRLVVTREMEFTPTLNVVNEETYYDVINSKKRMYYHEANQILDNLEMVPGYEPFVDNLFLMKKLSDLMDQDDKKRGSIEFQTLEQKIETNEQGDPIELGYYKRGSMEQIVRNFMVRANESILTELYYKNLPADYRIHQRPDEEGVLLLIEALADIGITIKPPRDINNQYEMQHFYNNILKQGDSTELSELIIRKMFRAKYSAYNIGHFCLALKAYGHFTSPIRRFADLLLVTLMKYYKENPVIEDPEKLQEEIERICLHLSKKEKNIDEAERDVKSYLTVKYFYERQNQNFNATIVNINRNYLTINVDNKYHAVIDITKFFGKKYRFDDRTNMIIYQGQKFHIGDEIVVSPCELYLDDNHVSFRYKGLIKEKTKDRVMVLK